MKTMDLKMSFQCVTADPLIIRCFSHLRACQTQPDIFITVFQIKIIVFVTSIYGLIIIVILIIATLRTFLAKEKTKQKNSDPIYSFW